MEQISTRFMFAQFCYPLKLILSYWTLLFDS